MLPKSVRIGYKTFEIQPWPEQDAKGAGYVGWCDREAHIIKIKDGGNGLERANTLIHEMLHGCWDNMPFSGEQEEQVVSVLADALTQIWRDNPDVIKWITKATAEQKITGKANARTKAGSSY